MTVFRAVRGRTAAEPSEGSATPRLATSSGSFGRASLRLIHPTGIPGKQLDRGHVRDDLERRLPEAEAVFVAPLARGTLIEAGAEARSRWRLEIRAKRPREHAGQFLRVPALLGANGPGRVRLLEQRVAVAVRVEHLPVHACRGV